MGYKLAGRSGLCGVLGAAWKPGLALETWPVGTWPMGQGSGNLAWQALFFQGLPAELFE